MTETYMQADRLPAPEAADVSLQVKNAPVGNRDFNRLVNNLPTAVLSSLTDDQLVAIEWALKTNVADRHYVEFRGSLPFLSTGMYLVVLAGREKRSKARLHAEGQIGTLRWRIVYSFIIALLLIFATLVLLTTLYIWKSALGIDLTEGPSFLHALLYR